MVFSGDTVRIIVVLHEFPGPVIRVQLLLRTVVKVETNVYRLIKQPFPRELQL